MTFACSRRPWTGAARDGGGERWKSQNRKNVHLSPYVEEPLNSKVIKGFVPELRSRKCFSYFEIPMFCVYVIYTNIMNVLCTGMNMSISHIAVSGYGIFRRLICYQTKNRIEPFFLRRLQQPRKLFAVSKLKITLKVMPSLYS